MSSPIHIYIHDRIDPILDGAGAMMQELSVRFISLDSTHHVETHLSRLNSSSSTPKTDSYTASQKNIKISHRAELSAAKTPLKTNSAAIKHEEPHSYHLPYYLSSTVFSMWSVHRTCTCRWDLFKPTSCKYRTYQRHLSEPRLHQDPSIPMLRPPPWVELDFNDSHADIEWNLGFGDPESPRDFEFLGRV